ncbi:MAG: OmpA family protein [Hydrogenophilales bacterium]|nr:OmpA family protein [Hydrogenophilales bacterium]
MKPRALTPILAVLIAGCQSLPATDAQGVPAASAAMFDQAIIHQLRDEDTGEAFYALSASGRKPTPKTRYTRVASLAPVPIIPLEKAVRPEPVIASIASQEPAPEPTPGVGQSEAFKRLVPFGFGRARLGPQGREAMAALLEEAKSAERVHVRGYTDIIGDMPGNKRLAMARAAEIRAYLILGGVAPEKISVSHCIDCFVESNESESGRKANRRAVVVMRPSLESVDTIDLEHRDSFRSGAALATPNGSSCCM